MNMYVPVSQDSCEDQRTTCLEGGSLLLPRGFQDSNSGLEVRQQVPSAAEPFPQPFIASFFLLKFNPDHRVHFVHLKLGLENSAQCMGKDGWPRGGKAVTKLKCTGAFERNTVRITLQHFLSAYHSEEEGCLSTLIKMCY